MLALFEKLVGGGGAIKQRGLDIITHYCPLVHNLQLYAPVHRSLWSHQQYVLETLDIGINDKKGYNKYASVIEASMYVAIVRELKLTTWLINLYALPVWM